MRSLPTRQCTQGHRTLRQEAAFPRQLDRADEVAGTLGRGRMQGQGRAHDMLRKSWDGSRRALFDLAQEGVVHRRTSLAFRLREIGNGKCGATVCLLRVCTGHT